MALDFLADNPQLCEDDVAAAPGPAQERPPRVQGLKKGRTKCWVPGCEHTHNLDRHPAERTADVFLQLRLPPHDLGPDVTYPCKLNKLCPEHLPCLTPHRVLGASVAVPLNGKFAEGVISDLGRGGLAVSNPEVPLQVAKPWRVDYKGVTPPNAPAFMSTEEVAQYSQLCCALKGTVKEELDGALAEKQRRVHALEQQVSQLRKKERQGKQLRLTDGAAAQPDQLLLQLEPQAEPGGSSPPPPPPSPTTRRPPRADTPPPPQEDGNEGTPPPSPLTRQRVCVSARLPPNHSPGSAFRFAVPAEYLPGSPRQVFDITHIEQ